MGNDQLTNYLTNTSLIVWIEMSVSCNGIVVVGQTGDWL